MAVEVERAHDSVDVAAAMREPVGRLCALVGEVFGDEVVGLTAYGAVATPEFDSLRMTCATALVVRRVDLDRLKALAARGPALGKLRVAAPLILTEEFISGSTDSFPLELLEIAERRVTLMGRDCFAGLELRAEHVRLQCERELRRVELRMRQGLLAVVGPGRSGEALSALVRDVGAHLVRTLRGLLWLHGRREYVPRRMVVEECERILQHPIPGVRAATQLHLEHGWGEFRELYGDIEFLTSVADRWA